MTADPRHVGGRNDDKPSPTHHIVTSRVADTGDRDRAGRTGWFGGLRFVHQSPGSLLDQIRWARAGAYTVATSGPWRIVNVAYARFWAVPALTVLYLVIWAYCTRLPRTLAAIGVALVVGPVLNSIPVLGLLVPDMVDLTTWWSGHGGGCVAAS